MTNREAEQDKMAARLDVSKLPKDGVVWAAKFSSCGMRKFSALGLGVSLTFNPKSGCPGPPTRAPSAASSDVKSAGGKQGGLVPPATPTRARLHSAPLQGRRAQPTEHGLVTTASRRQGADVTHRPTCHGPHDVRPTRHGRHDVRLTCHDTYDVTPPVPTCTHPALPPRSCCHSARPCSVPPHAGPLLQRAQSAPCGKTRVAGYMEDQGPPCSAWGRLVNYIVDDCPPDTSEKAPLLISSCGDDRTREVEQNNSSIYTDSLADSPVCQLESGPLNETAEMQVSDLSRPRGRCFVSVSHTSTVAGAHPNPHRSRSTQNASSPLSVGLSLAYPTPAIVTRSSGQSPHDVRAPQPAVAATPVSHVSSAPEKDRDRRATCRRSDVAIPDGVSNIRRLQEPNHAQHTKHTNQSLRIRVSGKVRPASVFAQELWYRKGRKLLLKAVPETKAEPTALQLDEDPDFVISRLSRPTVSSQSRQVALPYADNWGQDRKKVQQQQSAGDGIIADRFMGKKTVTVQQLQNMVQRLSYCTPAQVPDSSYSRYRAKGDYSRL